MSNKTEVSYSERAKSHPHPLAKRLFKIAERKQTNIVLSADLITTQELLTIADSKSNTRSTRVTLVPRQPKMKATGPYLT